MNKRCCWKKASASFLLCAAIPIALPAQTLTTLANFHWTDGADPGYGSLVQGLDGNFYGTTTYGGDNCGASGGCGTVFKITPRGTLTTLHRFNVTDGATPEGLTQGTDGAFYGTTTYGATNGRLQGAGLPAGSGTIFEITPNGTLITLHNFTGTDGVFPVDPLVQAANGDFYGTTNSGGTPGSNCPAGCGTIFKITPSGTLTTLHSFNATDGENPIAGLFEGTDGNFYGTTPYGGAGYGVVFKITADGTFTALHTFQRTDGDAPYGRLIEGADRNFYGTTSYGGAHDKGAIFRITPQGKLTTLYSFTGGADGSVPFAGLLLATDGNFYATTTAGGADNYGTIVALTPGGHLTPLLSFHGSDGNAPYGTLMQGTDGNLYGTTWVGGAHNFGNVFSLSLGLGRFVKTLPHSGNPGAAIKILGTNLTGATSVTFNGTAATFTVVSPSEIATSVPAGATTGRIQVTTPTGAIFSAAPFLVHP